MSNYHLLTCSICRALGKLASCDDCDKVRHNAALEKYTRYPIEKYTTAQNGIHNIYKDYWWIVTPKNEILKFQNISWQCNPHKEIAERLVPYGCEVIQIPLVFIPVNPHDYGT